MSRVSRRPAAFRARLRWGTALVLAATLAVVACGGSTDGAEPSPTPAVADLARVLGPWTPEPFPIDPAIAAAADAKCRSDPTTQVRNPNLRLVVVDARGEGLIHLVYAAGAAFGDCQLRFDRTGTMTSTGSGSGEGPADAGPNEVTLRSASGSPSSGADRGDLAVIGVAGSNVAAVRIVRANGESITASLGGGTFAAWWPVFDRRYRIEGYDASGTLVGEQLQ